MRKLVISFLLLCLAQVMQAANTDVSNIDNVIYISPFTASAGTEMNISIKMKNTAAIRGFQFNLYLPDGITAVKSSKGRIQGSLSEGRLPDEDEHDLTFSEHEDGSILFLCSSQYDETFTGNDGEIATLRVKIADNMDSGNHSIQLKNVKLTETDISIFYITELVETTVTIGEVDARTILDETSTTAPEAAADVDVKVLRTINANEWSTICLPFAMTAAQVTEAFGNDVQLADFNDYDFDDEAGTISVKFTNATAIEANHPYIIKVSKGVTEFTANGVTIDPKEAIVDFDTSRRKNQPRQMVGTYVANTVLDWGTLFLSGNQFWYSIGSTKMKGYRAYFNFIDLLTEFEDSYEARISMSFDEASGIHDNNRETIADNRYYDLQGRSVETPARKGLYIRNGKKVTVK